MESKSKPISFACTYNEVSWKVSLNTYPLHVHEHEIHSQAFNCKSEIEFIGIDNMRVNYPHIKLAILLKLILIDLKDFCETCLFH